MLQHGEHRFRNMYFSFPQYVQHFYLLMFAATSVYVTIVLSLFNGTNYELFPSCQQTPV